MIHDSRGVFRFKNDVSEYKISPTVSIILAKCGFGDLNGGGGGNDPSFVKRNRSPLDQSGGAYQN